LPGRYNITLELAEHYPWFGEVDVEAGKVNRLDKVILFPLRPNIKQLNKDRVNNFLTDAERGRIYYIDYETNIIYRSDLEGAGFKESGSIPMPENSPPFKKFKLSADREKLACFNLARIAVAPLEPTEGAVPSGPPAVLDVPGHKILDLFWHSDSYHLILITDKNIIALEAKPGSAPVNLATLNKRNCTGFYDTAHDALYFIDSEKAEDGKLYDNVYKLELGSRLSPSKELIKPGANE
jgi:hypothetical protein